MTDLTELWKKGELPEGVYYCNTGNTVETLFTWGKNYHQLTNNKDEVYIPEMDDCIIIAPVPNYDEWFKIKNLASLTSLLQEKNIECLHRENMLKELLKDCRLAIFDYPPYDLASDKIRLMQKIDEVLND